MTHMEPNMGTRNAIAVLHETLSRAREERTRTRELLVRLRDLIGDECARREDAEKEVARLSDHVVELERRNETLLLQVERLNREVNTMAAAIHVANEEIFSSDLMLHDLVTAVGDEVEGMSLAQNAVESSNATDQAIAAVGPLSEIERLITEALDHGERDGAPDRAAA